MLQNRVDPFGQIIKTKARGAWLGNRGVLHNENKELLRPFKLKAWITCLLHFKGKKRPVMAPDRWTELFFLDEATAFSAGHRPCGECRRDDFNRFKRFWLKGNPEYHFNEKTAIREIDKIIHEERIDRNGAKLVYEQKVRDIPDGAFVRFNDKAFLVSAGLMFLWTPFGYEMGIAPPVVEKLPVLTPRSIVNTIRAGYLPSFSPVLP